MDQKQFEAMLSDAETRLRRLKFLYEQWFMGFERTEPATLRKELEDLLTMLRREQGGNTALRFRFAQLIARHLTFATYWRRISRQIEEGTYQRDVLRAKRHRARAGQERDNGGPELELSYDVDLDDELEAALEEANRAVEAERAAPPVAAVAPAPAPLKAPAALVPGPPAVPLAAAGGPRRPAPIVAPSPPSPAGAAAPRPVAPRGLSPFSMPAPAAADKGNGKSNPLAVPKPASAAAVVPAAAGPRVPAANPTAARPASPAALSGNNSLSTDDVQRIYTQYLAARKQNSERVDNVKRDTIEKTLRGMLPQLEQKHAGKKIDFEVVVKDGKVALKPVAK